MTHLIIQVGSIQVPINVPPGSEEAYENYLKTCPEIPPGHVAWVIFPGMPLDTYIRRDFIAAWFWKPNQVHSPAELKDKLEKLIDKSIEQLDGGDEWKDGG